MELLSEMTLGKYPSKTRAHVANDKKGELSQKLKKQGNGKNEYNKFQRPEEKILFLYNFQRCFGISMFEKSVWPFAQFSLFGLDV